MTERKSFSEEVAMRYRIIEQLWDCEKDRNVEILFAAETGSKTIGFDSPDSDYDVRFVYKRPTDDYLTLRDAKDTIEWCLDDELDINGWDLGKFLRLLRKSNPSALEWLACPMYVESNCVGPMQTMAERCLNPASLAFHYVSMAVHHDMRYIRGGNATYKNYLYAVRAILAARWAIENQCVVPMYFQTLMDAKLERELRPIVKNLVHCKRNSLGKEHPGPIQELDAWIGGNIESLRLEARQLQPRKQVSWQEMDELFRNVLKDHF